MKLTSWLRKLTSTRRRQGRSTRPARCRPELEALEDRCLMSYTPIDLGVLPDAGPNPSPYARGLYGINDLHQVVGASATATSTMHAVMWDNGAMTDLGTLGGSTSLAQDINNAGQVAGWANTASAALHAFRWQNGVMTDLGVAGTDSVFSTDEGLAMNNAGVVAGYVGSVLPQSFVWEDGVLVDFATLLPANSGWSYLRIWDVNNAGQIVGSGALNGADTAFLYRDTDGDGKFATGPGQIISLGSLGGYPYSEALAVNDLGQVVGQSYKYGDSRPFLWTPSAPNAMSGTMKDLGTLKGGTGAAAFGINNAGDVVGVAGYSTTTAHAVIWPGGTQIQDLNTLVPSGSPVLTRADAISNDGRIDMDDSHFLLIPGTVNVPLVSISDATVTEGDSGTTPAVFTVTLSRPSSNVVTVSYSTGSGLDYNGWDAQPNVDYVSTSGTLTFLPGETSKTITVQVIGDTIPEANNKFAVNLGRPTNALLAHASAVGTIVDDDGRISINSVSLADGSSGTTAFVFTVTLSKAASVPIDVSFSTSDGTAMAGSDYIATSGTLTFAPGETTKTITVWVIGDTVYDANEYFFVNLSSTSPYAIFTNFQGIGTILNDDPQPTPGKKK